MFNIPLLWYGPALLLPMMIPVEHRDWRYFEEFQVIRTEKDWLGGNEYALTEVFCPDTNELPFELYIHPPKGWAVAHTDVVYYNPSDTPPLRSDFFQCWKSGPKEWRGHVMDFSGGYMPGHSFFIRVWILRLRGEPEDPFGGPPPFVP